MAPHFVIIGGTSGAGRTFSKRAASRGDAVSVIGRHVPDDDWTGMDNALVYVADLRKAAEIEAAVQAILKDRGKPSHLVFYQRFRGDGDKWRGEIDVTLSATKDLIEGFAGHFDGGEANAIVIIGSVATTFIADEQPAGYHAMKGGQKQLAKFYACLLGPKGIRVNVVSPATVVTEENASFYEDQKELANLYTRITPLRRLGTADDLADVVDYLCSPQASFITGAEIVVDGGLSQVAHTSMARAAGNLNNLNITRD